MVHRCRINRWFRFSSIFLVLVTALLLMSLQSVCGQSSSSLTEGEIAQKALVQKQEKHWAKAMDLFSHGEDEDAAKYFLTFYTFIKTSTKNHT